ncbi:MAG: sensor histidine kinase [Verrucomicrobia bacterium]|nr:sensor histidine kinase [Verrucomicrobiota bacterium]
MNWLSKTKWAASCLTAVSLLAWPSDSPAQSALAPPPVLSVLTNVVQVKRLSTKEAERHHPVRLRGVVTYFEWNPDWQLYTAILQDETGGISFSPGRTAADALKLKPGNLVEIEGISAQGQFAPEVRGTGKFGSAVRAKVLGPAPELEPQALTPEQMANPFNQDEWVEVKGVVRRVTSRAGPKASGRVMVDFSTASGTFRAIVPTQTAPINAPTNLVGAAVSVRGVFAGIYNEKRRIVGAHLMVSSLSHIIVEEAGADAAFKMPLLTASSLMQFRPDMSSRVHVSGVVTLFEPGSHLYLRDNTGALRIETPETSFFRPGDRVEVVGFPAFSDGAPLLLNAFLKKTGSGPPPKPKTITIAQASSGEFDGELVRLDGVLLDQLKRPENVILMLQSGDTVFSAHFAEGAAKTNAPSLMLDSWVQISGVCLNQFRYSPEPRPKPPQWRPVSFHVVLRSPRDVTLLREPPWWTPERIVWGMGLLAAAIFVVLAWVVVLRRQVTAQTRVIQQKVQREVLMDERSRIARDLHDTLEQQLALIGVQIDSSLARLAEAPALARKSLELALAVVRHTHEEARRSVWDLRSVALEQGGVAEALRQLAAADDDAQHKVRITTRGEPRRLPVLVETNLMRIAQEAVTNAIKHSGGSRIEVSLDYGSREVTLRVRDDGRGFDPEKVMPASSGRFGLMGMRERAEKMNAVFALSSQPGQATEIAVTVPLTNGATENTTPTS